MMPRKKIFYSSLIMSVIAVAFAIYFSLYSSKSKTIRSSELLTEIMNEGEQIRLGSADAPNTLTVFYDYSCNICRRFFFNTLPELKNELSAQQLTILLKPVNLNGDELRTEAYHLLYCLENYGLFNQMHKILLLEPDYIYHSDFRIYKEALFNENIDLQQCTEYFSQEKIIENNKILMHKLGYQALPLYIFGNKALPGHQTAEKIKSLIQ